MRVTKAGKRYQQDLNIQNMPHNPVDPVALVTGNMLTARRILTSNMQRYGSQLPAKLRGQLAVVLANLEGAT